MLINARRTLPTTESLYILLMKTYRCRKSVEIHDKRHREIAELLQIILHSDGTAATTLDSSLLLSKRRKSRKSSGFESPGVIDAIEGKDDEDDWADTSTACEDDIDLGKLSLVGKINITNTARVQKQERKAAKSHERLYVITDEDVNKISDALHPCKSPLFDKTTGHDLLNNSFVDANVSFDAHTFKYSSLRHELHKRKSAKAKGIAKAPSTETIPDTRQITDILGRLGVGASSTTKLTKDRKNALRRLYDAIEKDLVCVENEEREIMMRMAGYWRFANKRTYNYMVRKNELWDWATGDKLLEIDEEAELEDDERDDSFSQQDTDVASVGKDEGYFLCEHEKLLDDEKTAISLDHSPDRRTNDITRGLASGDALTLDSPSPQSPWQGLQDTRHLTSPTRNTMAESVSPLSHSDEDNDSSPQSDIPPATPPASKYHGRLHVDPNNRFSPLAIEGSSLPRAAVFRLFPLAHAANAASLSHQHVQARVRPKEVLGLGGRLLWGKENESSGVGFCEGGGWMVSGRGGKSR